MQIFRLENSSGTLYGTLVTNYSEHEDIINQSNFIKQLILFGGYCNCIVRKIIPRESFQFKTTQEAPSIKNVKLSYGHFFKM